MSLGRAMGAEVLCFWLTLFALRLSCDVLRRRIAAKSYEVLYDVLQRTATYHDIVGRPKYLVFGHKHFHVGPSYDVLRRTATY